MAGISPTLITGARFEMRMISPRWMAGDMELEMTIIMGQGESVIRDSVRQAMNAKEMEKRIGKRDVRSSRRGWLVGMGGVTGFSWGSAVMVGILKGVAGM